MDNLQFETEKSKNNNWNLFLFDLCKSLLDNNQIIHKNYEPKVFGSWVIEFKNIRFVYDGRDNILSIQIKTKDGWKDKNSITKKELTYSLIKENTHNHPFSLI